MRGRIVLEVEVDEEGDERRVVKRNLTLNVGEKFALPSSSYHTIYTVSSEPSCYVYLYLNKTASILDSLLSSYFVNMESFYNRTLLEIADIDAEREEKALNLTLVENSRNFFRMLINYTKIADADDVEKINRKLNEIDQLFSNNKLNKTKIYNDFVDKFHTFMSDQEKTVRNSKENIIGKIKRKLNSNWSRFKQR